MSKNCFLIEKLIKRHHLKKNPLTTIFAYHPFLEDEVPPPRGCAIVRCAGRCVEDKNGKATCKHWSGYYDFVASFK